MVRHSRVRTAREELVVVWNGARRSADSGTKGELLASYACRSTAALAARYGEAYEERPQDRPSNSAVEMMEVA